jgi:GntR family transcriptional regulator
LATRLAINQNTVLEAYRASLVALEPLQQDLVRWLTGARRAGMDSDSVRALFTTSLRSTGHDN